MFYEYVYKKTEMKHEMFLRLVLDPDHDSSATVNRLTTLRPTAEDTMQTAVYVGLLRRLHLVPHEP